MPSLPTHSAFQKARRGERHGCMLFNTAIITIKQLVFMHAPYKGNTFFLILPVQRIFLAEPYKFLRNYRNPTFILKGCMLQRQ